MASLAGRQNALATDAEKIVVKELEMSLLTELPAFDKPQSIDVVGNGHGPRIYTLQADPCLSKPTALEGLLVERFALSERLSEGFVLELHVLHSNAQHPVNDLIGEPVQLKTRLADGSFVTRSALVSEVQRLRIDGGFTRFRLVLQSWIFKLRHQKHSRVWQNKTVMQIIDNVLSAYLPLAAWQWGEAHESIQQHIEQGPFEGVHPYCVQYRESDFAFVQRLLAQEGLGWRVEERQDRAGFGHQVVFFADSALCPQDVTSASATGGVGIRFHRSESSEAQDAIQSLASIRRLQPLGRSSVAWDPQAKQAVSARVPSLLDGIGPNFQPMGEWMQSYSPLHVVEEGKGFGSAALEHLTSQRQQALEARSKGWLGWCNVRSLAAGRWFSVTQFDQAGAKPGQTQQALDERRQFVVLALRALGDNNLQYDPNSQATRGQPFKHPQLQAVNYDKDLQEMAQTSGHANRFEAVRRKISWRPGGPSACASAALGTQTALVVGPDGETTPSGGNEIHTDAQGRVRVRFHWQNGALHDSRADNQSSCWVRVSRRWAGPGMGLQRTPRIGDEVVVAFVGGQAHLPVVVGAVPNGQGEAGLPPSPGGVAVKANRMALTNSHDHLAGSQGNLIHGGRSPAWHGGGAGYAAQGAEAQNNMAAMSGFKSTEWGGQGFNQLVWDDTPQQLRTQMGTTQHGTQLNLGHILHQADNHRGSFRGLGFELRTDAYGAVRARQGLMLSTYPAQFQRGVAASPAFDNTPGMALMKQALSQATRLSELAQHHRITTLAAVRGSHLADQSKLSDREPPLKALNTALKGMADSNRFEAAQQDAMDKSTDGSDGRLPQTTDPLVTLVGKAGLAVLAGKQMHWVSDDIIGQQAGRDIQWAVGGQMRWHAAQSIGVLAGVDQPGNTSAAGSGLTLVNDKGVIDVQAQTGTIEVASREQLTVQSAGSHIDLASAKRIVLSTAAGAQIVIEAGGITHKAPGKLTVYAMSRSLTGPGQVGYPLPKMPEGFCLECLLKALKAGSPFAAKS